MEFILNTLGQIGFNWHVALANFLNFLIIFFILKKFVFAKIFNILDNREKIIKTGLENSRQAEIILNKAKDDSDNILKSARDDADSIKTLAYKDAEDIKKSLESESKDKLHNLELDLNQKIKEADKIAMLEWDKNKKELLSHFLENVFAKNLTKEDNDKIVAGLLR
jgi:F-type H+-transporting ATPase subunit b